MPAVKNTQKVDKGNQGDILKKVAEDLIPIEQSIKAGGNQIISYEKDRHETIGSVVNSFAAHRVDTSGEFRPKAVTIEGKGSFVKNETVPYIETVENSRFPCGTYSVNVTNKYDLTVGNGGLSMSTGGNMNVTAGARSVIAAAQEMNVSSSNNVNIRAGSNISLKSDSMNLECPNQVVVNSNLGVSKNAIINGCAFIDGEVYLHHVTCPAEVQYTGGGMGSFGQFMTGSGPTGSEKGAGGTSVIAYADLSYVKKLYDFLYVVGNAYLVKLPWSLPEKVPVLTLSEGGTNLASTAGNGGSKANPTYSVFVYPHEHPFNNIPLSFTTGNEQMRAKAAGLNSGSIGTAGKIQHGYKTPGV